MNNITPIGTPRMVIDPTDYVLLEDDTKIYVVSRKAYDSVGGDVKRLTYADGDLVISKVDRAVVKSRWF